MILDVQETHRDNKVIRGQKYKEMCEMKKQRQTEEGKINIFVMKNVDESVAAVTAGVQVE